MVKHWWLDVGCDVKLVTSRDHKDEELKRFSLNLHCGSVLLTLIEIRMMRLRYFNASMSHPTLAQETWIVSSLLQSVVSGLGQLCTQLFSVGLGCVVCTCFWVFQTRFYCELQLVIQHLLEHLSLSYHREMITKLIFTLGLVLQVDDATGLSCTK